MKNALIVIALIVLVIAVIGLGPLLTIAAANTLFNLGIAYNFWTWLSTLWLSMCIFPTKQYFTKKD